MYTSKRETETDRNREAEMQGHKQTEQQRDTERNGHRIDCLEATARQRAYDPDSRLNNQGRHDGRAGLRMRCDLSNFLQDSGAINDGSREDRKREI